MVQHKGDCAYSAFRLLQITFVIAPILAGLDKFFYLLTDWTQYLSPFFLQFLPVGGVALMAIVGVVEIIAGLGVIWKPQIFAYIIAVWLLLIIINLVATGRYFDVALRDLGLLLAAVALGLLACHYAPKSRGRKEA